MTLGQSFNLSELLCPQLRSVNDSSCDDLNEIIKVNTQVNYAAALRRDKWQGDGGGNMRRMTNLWFTSSLGGT